MKIIRIITWGCLFFLVNSVLAQTEVTGSIQAILNQEVDKLPSSFTNKYTFPSSSEDPKWRNVIANILDEKYADAATGAKTFGYELQKVTDGSQIYYLLRRTSGNKYWGVYAFNSTASRSNLVIQSPHPIADRNSGKQGAYVFREVGAYAFFLSGTHRCNSSTASSCSGKTSICSESSQKYRLSDVAHNSNSAYQSATEVMEEKKPYYFIQLHGFTMEESDPHVILSNGTRSVNGTDKIKALKEQLLLLDKSLTFKIGHIDLTWNRLLAFTNTQGRHINNSTDPCGTNATKATGRFIHIEQEYSKLRADESKWDIVAKAIKKSFISDDLITGSISSESPTINIYPNPTKNFIEIKTENNILYDLVFKDLSGKSIEQRSFQGSVTIPNSSWKEGVYTYQIRTNGKVVYTGKILKTN